MIVNIRGTGGSGKSTLVRDFMDAWLQSGAGASRMTLHSADVRRKRPTGYVLCRGTEPRVAVIGHYETACGGCDTMKTVDEVFDLLREQNGYVPHVLFEGIMVGDDVRRTVELASSREVVVVGLTTPVEVCLRSIADRRAARGDERPLDPKNTTSRAGRLERHYVRLAAGGARVERHGRENAATRLRELLS